MTVHEQLTTRACELSCAFCAHCKKDGADPRLDEASPLERGRVVRLIGGDPFARRNLGAWIAWARERGAARVEVEGPGHRLAYEGPREAIVRARPDLVRVLLPAIDEEASRAITGLEGVPRRTLAALASLHEAGLRAECVVPANALTVPHLARTLAGVAELCRGLDLTLVVARRALPDGEWRELPALSEALEGSRGLSLPLRVEGYAPCMLAEGARGRIAPAGEPHSRRQAECLRCAWRDRCDFEPDLLAPVRAPIRAIEGAAPIRAIEDAPPARWDRKERDLPDLLCFAPFTTMAITELRHRPVPCAQAWVHTSMTADQEAAVLGVPAAEIEALDARAQQGYAVPHFDAGNEDCSLRELWNAPLLRHMRRQMVRGGPSDRCRRSCRVVLGVEERGVELLSRPDAELAPEVVQNRALLVEEIRAERDELRATPLEIAIGVSAHCNITCGFCSGPGGAYGELHSRRRAELEAMLPGMMALTVSGPGEPLMSKSFQALLAHVAERGYPSLELSLTTNGTLLTPEWLARHRGVRFGHVRMSINAGSARTHERMTGKKLWDRVLANASAVASLRDRQERPFRLTLSCVISELVLGDLAAFAELVHAHRAEIVLEPMTGDDEGLSPYKSAERAARAAAECREVAASFANRNPKIARAFDAMASFATEHAEGPLVQILPRR